MDLLHVCVVLTLCLAMMTHIVFSAPAFSQDLEEADDSQFEIDPEMVLFRGRRDVADVDDESSPEFLSRLRRQVSQMENGRRRYGGRGHRRRGRYNSHRHYQNRRNLRARGRLATW